MQGLSGRVTYLSDDGEALIQVGNDTAQGFIPWYAVQTWPRHEKRVQEYLNQLGIECFLPLYRTTHHWKNGCNMQVELPLFPNYLFVRINPQFRVRVLEVPGTFSFVGSSGELWPLPAFEIESLRSSLHLRKFEPHEYLTVGQKVRIVAGPLADLTGILVRKCGALRVVLSLDLIRRSVAVEVAEDDIEAIDHVAPHFEP